ncbi:hypothetical protein [Pedobacter sp. L105]|uniref:hypothetical protein n=1 Tax=Pedobacter sp. L105 TaxID=1641871 RepID=UPI00131DE7D9|nr:hypothetical protein [Pedobacter sp. L105]
MRKYSNKFNLIALTLLLSYAVFSQTVSKRQLHFGETYSAESTTCTDVFMELKVSPGKVKFPCTITVNQEKISGYLIKDSEKANQGNYRELYDFMIPKQLHPLLGISFYTEDNKPMALILNQAYLKIFKPCFEVKGIELVIKDSGQ